MEALICTCVVLLVIVAGMFRQAVTDHRHRMRMADELGQLRDVNEVYEKLLASMATLNEGMAGMRGAVYISQMPDGGVVPGRTRICLGFDDQADRIAVHQALQKIWGHWRPEPNNTLQFGSLAPNSVGRSVQRLFD